MTSIQYEWDEAKNLVNQRKHGVSFEEASQVFCDPLNIAVKERIVDGEQRWQALGFVNGILLLLVAYTLRERQKDDELVEVIRIISARRATPKERRRYEEENS